jgi:hypothetical protein
MMKLEAAIVIARVPCGTGILPVRLPGILAHQHAELQIFIEQDALWPHRQDAGATARVRTEAGR